MPRTLQDSPSHPTDPAVAPLLGRIAREMALAFPDEERIAAAGADLLRVLAAKPAAADGALLRMARLSAECEGLIPETLPPLLARMLAEAPRPWPALEILLASEVDEVRRLGLEAVGPLLGDGRLAYDADVRAGLAGAVAADPELLADAGEARRLARALRGALTPRGRGGSDPLIHRFVTTGDPAERGFLASLLDASGTRGALKAGADLFAAETWRRLRPRLAFTGAGFRDLDAILRGAGGEALAASLDAAEAHGGRSTLRAVLSTSGWERFNLGLRITPYVRVEAPGSLPLPLPADEALLCRGVRGLASGSEFLIAELHGCTGGAAAGGPGHEDPVERFRALNLVHAELLAEFMDMAPLDAPRIGRIMAAMDVIVREYAAVFGGLTREARILPDVYAELKAKVEAALAAGGAVTAEVSRLVLMFEDPRSASDARTVHALKRYLHQKGLELGLKLVDTSRSPGHTVDLLRLDPDGEATVVRSLRYAVFEAPPERDPDPWLIRPVALAAAGFKQQLVHGQTRFPDVNIFVFGNEAHATIAFRNHPAFLRLDLSPPRRGGMIDLRYLGVSNYELDAHPAFDLEAIQLFFRRLGFDVKKDGISLKIRYDKETCPDLGDLELKAAALFRLAPHLMSVDWAVGSLDLPHAAKSLAAAAWAERFAASGVLPLRDVVTEDGRAVIVGRERGPAGPVVNVWSGAAPYVDRAAAPFPAEALAELRRRLEELGVETPGGEPGVEIAGLLDLRRAVFDPLRAALDAGCVTVSGAGLARAAAELRHRESAPETFARLLAGSGRISREAVAAAPVVAALESLAPLETVGAVGSLEVLRGRLQVRGGALSVLALRDGRGVVRMGYLAADPELTRRRDAPGARWRDGMRVGAELHRTLQAVDDLANAPDAAGVAATTELAELRAAAAAPLPQDDRGADAGERLLRGRPASPGRVMGRAVFGGEEVPVADLAGAVLFARRVSPEDAPRFLHAAGFVSAGGSILSHACLMALQFGKPALLVEAEYLDGGRHRKRLRFSTPLYRTERLRSHGFALELRRIESVRTDEVREGDLVVLDCDAGCVRVLGQERDALALAEGLRMLDEAGRRGEVLESAADLMEARGLKLRARHQLEKTLARLRDPALAVFAVDELVDGRSCRHVGAADRLHLLEHLFANADVGDRARRRLGSLIGALDDRLRRSLRRARERLPVSDSPCEILGLRLRVLDDRDTLAGTASLAAGCGLEAATTDPAGPQEVDAATRRRLAAVREAAAAALDAAPACRRRHLLRRIDALDQVLGDAPSCAEAVSEHWRRLAQGDAAALAAAAGRPVLGAVECGYEVHPLIGWKAANLAEMSRLLGRSVSPSWFVVTDAALAQMLAGPDADGAGTLGAAIRGVLAEPGLAVAERARRIRELWRRAPLPEDLAAEVKLAYRRLAALGGDMVALRSSFCDEDTETTARAGQYDSFLQVSGEDQVLEHLRLAWAGLWSERALAAGGRRFEHDERPTGGVLVQVMVEARSSGVLQTVDVARDDHRSLVATVGLGLGEGVVSGTVATDLVTVAKSDDPDDRELRLHYVTNDKTTQVVADRRRAGGTRVAPTLYHQRLRPALEYLELSELADMALRLERLYGYPLDVEFAVAGLHVWLLQARPIGAHAAALRETLERRPLAP